MKRYWKREYFYRYGKYVGIPQEKIRQNPEASKE